MNANDVKYNIDNYLIYSCITGSHAYGMATESSDVDVRGIFDLPLREWLSPYTIVDFVEGDGDTVYYGLNKFLNLITSQNPNILELLWVNDENLIITETESSRFLRNNRKTLLSKEVFNTFGGYAMAQFKKMVSHNKWINKPLDGPPKMKDFVSLHYDMTTDNDFLKNGLPDKDGYILLHLSNDSYLLHQKEGCSWFTSEKGDLCIADDKKEFEHKSPLALVQFNRNHFKSSQTNWNNYKNWKNNEKSERRLMEEERGYDTKNASHLLRLLMTGRDALLNGELTIKRPEAAFLLDVRAGKYNYNEIVEMSESLNADLSEAFQKSELPKTVDREVVKDIRTAIYEINNSLDSNFSNDNGYGF